MLPIVRVAADGQEHPLNRTLEAVADELRLSEADRQERLPSGGQTRLYNRLCWAVIHLRKAGLLEQPSRGRFRITERGRQVLLRAPAQLDLDFLSQFPEFLEFKNSRGAKAAATRLEGQTANGIDAETARDETPEESLERSYANLRKSLASDLIERVRHCSPRFFEQLVVDLLVSMGYGGSRKDAGEAVGQSGDGGIDGIIKEDRLGLDAVYIQAKRWDAPVGRPVVQAFAGSLEGHRARKGVLISSSRFTEDAKEYVRMIEKKIVLIDGE